jgi:cell division protein FtsN
MKLQAGAFAKHQRGGFAMGLIVGLLIGLALALGVALYIAKVPSPFHDKVPHRSPEQDAAEAEKLKNWDPNAGLGGKPVTRPAGPGSASQAAPAPSSPAIAARAAPASQPATTPPPKADRDAAAILAGEPVPGVRASAPARSGAEPFIYYVQAGAFSSPDDAEQQRAKLALQGFAAKITQREQSGRTVHRVRLGPFDSQADAEGQQERVKALGVDAALVRLERPRN